ncbi:MAG TPA: (Fe-S)-binding protein, partial [Actinomycetes bacterium]|nr:(Fe-S)-binding protein [Actinomycetes bacterium]
MTGPSRATGASPSPSAASPPRPPSLPLFDPELLDRCISCGFCLPACPTYALTQEEASSPRGRITLMRAVQTGRLPLSAPEVTEQSSFCLGCRACEVVCPAGVRYGALLEQWRDASWTGRRRPLRLRALLLAARQRWAIALLGRLRRAARPGPARAATGEPAGGDRLLLGCFERILYPGVSRAAVNVSAATGDPAPPAAAGCCGALHAHNGELDRGGEMARRLGAAVPGVIVTTSGGCAAHLAEVLGRDRVVEISERLGRAPALPAGRLSAGGRPLRVGLQDSCHLRNGLGVFAQPRAVLRGIADYVEIDGADRCCGAAGTYSMLRAHDSRRVLAAKLDAIEAA